MLINVLNNVEGGLGLEEQAIEVCFNIFRDFSILEGVVSMKRTTDNYLTYSARNYEANELNIGKKILADFFEKIPRKLNAEW